MVCLFPRSAFRVPRLFVSAFRIPRLFVSAFRIPRSAFQRGPKKTWNYTGDGLNKIH
jgi:hypothetical protein